MELVFKKIWFDKNVTMIVNIVMFFIGLKDGRTWDFRKSYMNSRFYNKKRISKYFCSIVIEEVQPAKILANVSLKLGKMSADNACCYIFHQPRIPEALKKMKKL